MKKQEKKKREKKKKGAKESLESLLALFYGLRWSAWLLLQVPPLEELWHTFLTTNEAGVMLAQLFTTGELGRVWEMLINGIMGKTGTLVFVALLALDWCWSHFPTTEINQLINQVRYVRNTPPISRPIKRKYVRVVYEGQGGEELLDIGGYHQMSLNRDGSLQLEMEEEQVMVAREGRRIVTLPQGRWCWLPEERIRLKYLAPSYKVQ